jgi:hypothetical protein
MDSFAAHRFDDGLAELAQADAATQEVLVTLQKAEDIALGGWGVHAEKKVG